MPQKTPASLNRDAAEKVAIQALGFLASEPEELGKFLSLAGIGPETLRIAAGDPGFLVAVLEFFMQNEDLLIRFAENINLRPTLIAAARYTLDGELPDT